jgi:hypothetical protein
MKTMSWSRYHGLSWSFTRIRTHLRHGGAKRRRRAAAAMVSTRAGAIVVRPGGGEPESSQADLAGGLAHRFLARVSQSLTRIFRTKRLRSDTDI